jgi:signal transduction histidine kinase
VKRNAFWKSYDPLEGEQGQLMAMRKSAKMTARIASAFFVLGFLLLILSIMSFGVSSSTPPIIGMIVLFFALFLLNAFKKAYVSSYLLSILPSIAVLAITIFLKSKSPGDDLHYFDSRIVLLGFCALPGLIFSQREPYLLYSTIAINFICVALYDPIHEMAGVGYFQSGFLNSTYYHINTISILISIGIVGGILMLKKIVISEEDKNEELSRERELRNQELEVQNEEISAQTEQLSTAYDLIEKQKQQLELYTGQLEELVKLKSNDLTRSNDELRKNNSELLQFSYTVSHNVRGPVARLMGLTNLLKFTDDNLSEENRAILAYIKESSSELDTVIRELSRIIDIRNELYTVKEKVFFQEEWEHVKKSLAGTIEPDMYITCDFSEAPFIYTIRPFLHSILYNLVGNAIRYRSPQRLLRVRIKSTIHAGKINISISDNGLGINLQQFGNNIFGMYKRFHTHVQGRGLGLFLVKTQVEALQGEIFVESQLNFGTTFRIEVKVPADIEGQVCFDCDYGSVLYNARINTMGLMWKRHVKSDEYRLLLTKCMEMLHVYGTPHWIADFRKLESLSLEDYSLFSDSVIAEGSQMGLRAVAVITKPPTHNGSQLNEVIKSLSHNGVEIEVFQTSAEAESWIEQK